MYAIIDAEIAQRAGWSVVDLARALIDGGARLLQLRAKDASAAWLLEAASAIAALTTPAGARLIVNDRADIARLAGASGVHLGQEDLAPASARAILGDEAMIGLSTHTVAQLDAAAQEPVDYIAIGPVFGTATKATGYEAVGLDIVRRATEAGRPVVAIGGITLENAASVIAAGASSVAVISDLVATPDPESRTREFLKRLEP